MGKEKKGFSLFTPLIGTTVIIIAIMVSAVIVQNDVRLSRSLSNSFKEANQEVAARTIKASTLMSISGGIDDIARDYFSSGHNYKCYGQYSCKNVFKTNFSNSMKSGINSKLYSDILSDIQDITGYAPQRNDCKLGTHTQPDMEADNCLSQAVINGLDVSVEEVGSNYEVKLKVKNGWDDSFGIKFSEPQQHQALVVSLKPDSSKFPLTFKAWEIMDKAISIYESLKAVDTSKDYATRLGDIDKTNILGIEIYGKTIYDPASSDKRVTVTLDGSSYGLSSNIKVSFNKPSSSFPHPVYSTYVCAWDSTNGIETHPILGDFCH